MVECEFFDCVWFTRQFAFFIRSGSCYLVFALFIDKQVRHTCCWSLHVYVYVCSSCHSYNCYFFVLLIPQQNRGTVISIVYCRCTYSCLETIDRKITAHYSLYCTVAQCELSYMCPDHDIKQHTHRVKLYRIGCVGSCLVLAYALT